ncbi:MAG: SH3 domain-containing protein, partial [Anaerolineae bacterium]|nr:SH3 domain-containing protein [Anaerolineae bacterium]
FYGGVYYNIIILPGSTFSAPQLVIAPTALAQTLASAPGAGTAIASTSADTSSEVAQSEAQPVVEVVTPGAPAGDGDITTGRVLLDPSANLQLRQRPSSDALSLGLAPSGTVLEVIGREGRPVALVEGQPEPPEAADYVDPAEGLAEDQDLDPATTWLYVSYETPDEGTITAWVLAQFLEVRDPDGDLQRIADLPTVPGNRAGEASGTELTPPPIPEDRVTATVYNLNPDARLNVRRTPTVEGEVLARLPLNTVVELIGFLDPTATADATPTPLPEGTLPTNLADIEWAFVSYSPAEGGTITGWVSTLYVQYSWNGRRIDAEELFQRELVSFISAERIGEIGGGAQQAAVPTADPLEDAYVALVELDPTANLQFRRSPDAQSESLNLIPSGTQLIVSARNADGQWLKTTFEGETGWISANFVSITFNGDPVDINEIPVDATESPAPEATQESNG